MCQCWKCKLFIGFHFIVNKPLILYTLNLLAIYIKTAIFKIIVEKSLTFGCQW